MPSVEAPDAAGEAPRRAAAFLDRDGVINIDRGFTHRPEDLAFTPTAVAAIRALNQAGYLAIVVTNQSGVARGLYRCEDVERFHDHLQRSLAGHGAHIDAFYYSPYHPAGSVAEFAIEHEDRKPRPGMLLRAMRDWRIDPARSFMIGDKQSDLEVAAGAGIPGFLVPANSCDLAALVREIIGA